MGKKGLSLLEILISALIMALAVTGLANIFFTGKKFILHSHYRTTSGEVARFFLDPKQMQVNQGTWTLSTNCLGSGNCPNEAWSEAATNMFYTASYTWAVVPGTTLRKLKADISWTER